MPAKAQLNALLSKKMNRQDFLKHVAIGMVAVSGVGTALKLLSDKQPQQQNSASGYGGSAYGGNK